MKSLYHRVIDRLKQLGQKHTKQHNKADTVHTFSASDILESYRIETKKINIDNQPFRLSGLLHILTNKISKPLKEQQHRLYYDVDREIGRYIVGDNDYIEQVLQPVMQYLIQLNSQSEIILHISKDKERTIIFDAFNPHASISKSLTQEESHFLQHSFAKAKNIADAMGGSLELKSGKRTGTHFLFSMPYIADKNTRSNQEKLKKPLKTNGHFLLGKIHTIRNVSSIFSIFSV